MTIAASLSVRGDLAITPFLPSWTPMLRDRHCNPASRRRGSSLALAALVLALFLVLSATHASEYWEATQSQQSLILALTPESPASSSVDDRRIESLNEAIPPSPEALVPAKPFRTAFAGPEGLAKLPAIDCLAAAVYYEAAFEPPAGQRAVAQVVLNRLRHPAFPNTVCGVVFQGEERITGCQFTFACDGSLNRRPSSEGWRRAQAIAAAALAGYVEPSVGHATHYHASYVQPYWAKDLTKLTTIASHIFYQWKGTWGAPSVFSQDYAGIEVMPLSASLKLADFSFAGAVPKPGRTNLVADHTMHLNFIRPQDHSKGQAAAFEPSSASPALPQGSGILEKPTQIAVSGGKLKEHMKAGTLLNELGPMEK